MQIESNRVPRKKYIIWLAILSLVAMIGASFRSSKIKTPKTVKIITRNGQLVEVNARLLAAYRKRVSDKELLNFISTR